MQNSEQACSYCANLLKILSGLSSAILKRARVGTSSIELLQEISATIIMNATSPIAVQWWLKEGDGYFRCKVIIDSAQEIHWEADNIDVRHPAEGIIVGTRNERELGQLYVDLLAGMSATEGICVTEYNSLWSNDTPTELVYRLRESNSERRLRVDTAEFGRSFVLIPLCGIDENLGFIHLKSEEQAAFNSQQIEFYEFIAESIAVALIHQTAQAKLKERVKELGCLYDAVRLANNPELSLDAVLKSVAELLPPAWQYPSKAAGRVVMDGRSYTTRGFKQTPHMQSANLVIGGEIRGKIDVVYLEERPYMYEGPFLKEERHLINALAREVASIIERRQAREEKVRLENQLRHADRLATIGQLAAGVAHELNEPLGNILGFAQLAAKTTGLSDTLRSDLTKIVDACLYSRKIVSKLKLFARQMPAQRSEVDINKMIEEELFFIESRCAKQGVRIELDLQPNVERIVADPGQLYQVLVNLAVNAVQAMPRGGTLTVSTRSKENRVTLIVADTGIGMTETIKSQIFVPFFTTKDVDQGTGLGLSVVHSIVAAHGGTIEVKSTPSVGSSIAISFPIGLREIKING